MGVKPQEIVDGQIVRLDFELSLPARLGARRDAPVAGRPVRRQFRAGGAARAIEGEIQPLVDRRLLAAGGLHRQLAVDDGDMVERLIAAGHRVRDAGDERAEIVGGGGRRRRAERNGRGFLGARRQRQFAVFADAQGQLQPVEFEAAHPHLQGEQGQAVEADAPAGRVDHQTPRGIADRQAAEADADAVALARDLGRTERDAIAGRQAALQAFGDGRLQGFQADRLLAEINEAAAGDPHRQGDDHRRPL